MRAILSGRTIPSPAIKELADETSSSLAVSSPRRRRATAAWIIIEAFLNSTSARASESAADSLSRR